MLSSAPGVSGGSRLSPLLPPSLLREKEERKEERLNNIDAIFSAMLAESRREAAAPSGVGLRLIEDLKLGLRREERRPSPSERET